MTIPPPCVKGKPLNILFYKNKDYARRAKGISFFVLVLSIFIYISIFYIFNLSPSLNNTKLWFFVSNTLIIIIAADYGVFSSSSEARNDVYDEYYAMHSQVKSATVSSFVPQYPHVVKTSISTEEDFEINPDEKEAISEQNGEHPHDEMETAINGKAESKPDDVENIPEKVVEIDQKVNNNDGAVLAVDNEKKPKGARTYRRSNSEKPKRVVIDESENLNIRRSVSESEREEEEEEEEDDEYSTMSDEELNRRIEEFIQRFNRQIRLQRAGNFRRI